MDIIGNVIVSQADAEICNIIADTLTKCELSKTRNNSVPGKGNFKSDVIFVGEAPGKNEDVNGEPFIGIAGKKLTIALENAGITRDEIYITNIVKCRPPKNRVPTITERDTCKNYLEKEIEIIKPKIICILGNTAFNSLLTGKEIIIPSHLLGCKLQK